MKKFLLSILAVVFCGPVFAEGYQVNMLSAKQIGMGHVGTGMKLGAESIHFNPAGLVFMRGHVDLSVGLSAISATAKYDNEGYSAKTDNPLSTPLYAYAGLRVYDNLAVGIGLTTPYGNALKWPKYWQGSHLIQEIALKSFVLQPTVSYKITDKLSVGASLMLATGNVQLSRTIMSTSDFQGVGVMLNQLLPANYPNKEQIIGTIQDNQFPPATATLEGKAQVHAGFNLGLFYDISEKVSVGVSYRSKITMKVDDGEAEMEYANRTVETLMGQLGQLELNGTRPLAVPKYDQGTFRAELPLPSNTNIGVSYRPNDRLELALDLQYVGWNAYDSLNVYFNEAELGIAPIKAEKNYKNTMIARVGAQYKTTERLFLRAGVYYDQTPIRENNFNPETPGMDKLGFSGGLSFSPYKNLQLDLAFLYIHGLSRDGSYTQKNVLTQQPEVFSGHYKTTALSASIGIAYCF